MAEIILNDAKGFAERLLTRYLELGFQSLSKRDVDLLIFLLLERDGAYIAADQSNYEVARTLRITPAKVKLLRRDAYARWRQLVAEDRQDAVRRVLGNVLTLRNIQAGARHAAEKNREEGFLAIRVEHANDLAELEQAILDVGAIPVYERNRDVIDVRFDTLLSISEVFKFNPTDPKQITDALKKLEDPSEELEELLLKPVNEISWADLRSVINKVGAKCVADLAHSKVTDLLKLAFPFLKTAG